MARIPNQELKEEHSPPSFSLGPDVRKLEEHIASYCQTQFAVTVSSGTDPSEHWAKNPDPASGLAKYLAYYGMVYNKVKENLMLFILPQNMIMMLARALSLCNKPFGCP